MDLRLNEDQSMMKNVAADFVKSEAPSYVITEWFQKKIAFHAGALPKDRRGRLAWDDAARRVRRRWRFLHGLRRGV